MQVSHHPPITAVYAESRENSIVFEGSVHTKYPLQPLQPLLISRGCRCTYWVCMFCVIVALIPL